MPPGSSILPSLPLEPPVIIPFVSAWGKRKRFCALPPVPTELNLYRASTSSVNMCAGTNKKLKIKQKKMKARNTLKFWVNYFQRFKLIIYLQNLIVNYLFTIQMLQCSFIPMKNYLFTRPRFNEEVKKEFWWRYILMLIKF